MYFCNQPEVDDINNRQKFLAELGRLLTFMLDEDRQKALSMYGDIFDMVEDEPALLQFLVSPTRQAVLIARSYDTTERKLHVRSDRQTAERADYAEPPAFMDVIDGIRREALSKGVAVQKPDSNQISLFDPGRGEELLDAEPEVAESEPERVAARPEMKKPVVDDESYATVKEFIDSGFTSVKKEEAPITEAPAEDGDDEGGALDAMSNAIDAFMSDFTVDGGELKLRAAEVSREEPEELSDAEPETVDVPSAPVETVSPVKQLTFEDPVPAAEELDELPDFSEEPLAGRKLPDTAVSGIGKADGNKAGNGKARKAIVPLLILYVIVAIPLCLLGIAILLVPVVLSLLVAAALVIAGVMGFQSAFGAFTMFSDVLLVVGAAIVILALGLFFAWLFVWLIGGAIVGFIRGVCRLGGKLCYREVDAQ